MCVLALTTLSMIVLLALYFESPLVGGDLPYDRMILIAVPTLLVLGVAGLLWVFLHVFPLARGAGRWSWWVLAAPVVVVAALVVIAAFPKPGFDEVRPELEEMALQILKDPSTSWPRGGEIGSLDFSRVEQGGDGAVYFVESDTSFGSTRGWVYAPLGEPERVFVSLEKLDDPWYRFEWGT